MEKNFNDMTMEELKELQELLETEIDKREEEKRKKVKNKFYELLGEIRKLCIDNNFNLYYTDENCNDYEISISDLYIC